MTENMIYGINPARIIFGQVTFSSLPDEIERLGCQRPLIVTTTTRRSEVEGLITHLDRDRLKIFSSAAMHTPVGVTAKALVAFDEMHADCIVAIGGGSSIGLGKAIAYRNAAPQIAIPTTYSGSEVTPILGQTEDGAKTTLRSPEVIPEVVIYDPQLSRQLPLVTSIASGMNAIAHAIEALYAKDRNPISSLIAIDGAAALLEALPSLIDAPDNMIARGKALYRAWLCGTGLGTVAMSLHHKLCHILGGTFDMPHAETTRF